MRFWNFMHDYFHSMRRDAQIYKTFSYIFYHGFGFFLSKTFPDVYMNNRHFSNSQLQIDNSVLDETLYKPHSPAFRLHSAKLNKHKFWTNKKEHPKSQQRKKENAENISTNQQNMHFVYGRRKTFNIDSVSNPSGPVVQSGMNDDRVVVSAYAAFACPARKRRKPRVQIPPGPPAWIVLSSGFLVDRNIAVVYSFTQSGILFLKSFFL